MAVNNLNSGVGIQPTIVDAKGDLIAATANDAVNRLAVGTNGQVLVADSGETTGLKWNNPGSVGGLVHIKSTTTSSVSSVDLTDCFNADFIQYRVMITAEHSTTAFANVRLLDGTTPATSANYAYHGQTITSVPSQTLSASTTTTSWDRSGSQSLQFISLDLTSPFLTKETRGLWNQVDLGGLRTFGLRHTLSNSYTGLQYFPSSGTITNFLMSVYGYKI